MREEDALASIIDFANRSLRDTADQDYISARIAYRLELDQQFRWNALQAVEKYLKAILLYNVCSAKGIGHGTLKALRLVRGIPDLGFDIPKRSEEFIEYLDTYGADRYLSYSTYVPPRALLYLDETAWFIRRYCFYMRSEFTSAGNIVSALEPYKKKLSSDEYKKFPNRYRIANGYLEQVLDKRLPSYDALVWNNLFFGKVKKHKIRIRDRFTATSPTHSEFPECFAELSKFVDFPKEIMRQFSSCKPER